MIIGITGSFCSGKSFVTSIIKSLGFRVFDCDEFVSKLYEENKFKQLLKDTFSHLKVGDKKEIGEHIFNDTKYGKDLEKFILSKVIKAIKIFINKYKRELIFVDAPILFESKIEYLFDFIINVSTTELIRRRRGAQKVGSSLYHKINRKQMSNYKKTKRVDINIYNSAARSKTIRQVREILRGFV